MNIICTGISKCDKLNYFREVKKFSEDISYKGKEDKGKINIHSVGDFLQKEIQKYGPFNKHILHKNDTTRAHAASAALKTIAIKILKESLKGKSNHNLISTHTTFLWKSGWKNSYNEDNLNDLNPDLFITVLDHEKRIQQKQHKDPQWKLENLSLSEVTLWQDKEVEKTEEWAKKFKKKHIVFGRNQSPETLYKLISYPEAPVFYASFPMTWLKNTEESYAKITENNEEMMKYGIVIDPRTIEIMKKGESDYSYNNIEQNMLKILEEKKGKNEELTNLDCLVEEHLKKRRVDEKQIIKYSTVNRDLQSYVKKCDVNILYLPEMALTFGGIVEFLTAYEFSIPTYLIIPEGYKSKEEGIGPFEEYHSLKVFFGINEFHDFLGKNFKKLDMYK